MDKYSVVDEWVLSDGYVSVEDWAFNSNYRYEKRIDTWFDEGQNEVDIYEQAYAAIESAGLIK